ncbi:MAG: AEC family transporter [Clostridiales bacterium]|jgi:predicted permease|nr:AEC family transporter [Clostridiales bacterium]
MGVLDAVQSILSILIMISIGYVLSLRGWFNKETPALFSRLVVRVSLPALMLSNLLTTFSKETLFEAGIGLMLPIFVILFLYWFGRIISGVLKVPPNRRGVFLSLFAFSNTIFIGLPVNMALFGEQNVSFVLLYYMSNTVIFWTIGVNGIRRDGQADNKAASAKQIIKNFLSPPLMMFIFAMILILFDVKLPRFIMDTSRYIGNLTTPMSMLYMGIIIQSIRRSDIEFSKDMLVVILGRFVIAPLLILGLMYFIPVPVIMKKVFVVQAAMPAMTQTSIVSRAYGADHRYAAAMVTATTAASLVFIPLYMLILGGI